MTKDEFDSFIAGFMMGICGNTMIRVSEFRTILRMVDDVLATEVATAKDKVVQTLNPVPNYTGDQQVPVPYDDTADNVPAMGGSSLDTAIGGSSLDSSGSSPQYGPPATEGSDPTIDVMAPTNADGSASDGGSSDSGGGSSDGGGGGGSDGSTSS
jgi:hypothetical protein